MILGTTTQIQNGGLTLAGGTIQNGTLSSSTGFILQSGSASAVLSGSGGVTKTTTGTVSLTGANTYSGGTVLNSGTLQLSGAGTLGVTSGATTINAGATLDLGTTTQIQNGGVTLAGGTIQNGTLSSSNGFALQSGIASAVLSGPSGVTKITSGTVSLTGANTYSGGTFINSGTLQLSGAGTLGVARLGAIGRSPAAPRLIWEQRRRSRTAA